MTGSVVYRMGTEVPLVPELDRHGLGALPVAACFDAEAAYPFNDGWVQARAVLQVLAARGFEVTAPILARVLGAREPDKLVPWLALAATAPSLDAFVAGLE